MPTYDFKCEGCGANFEHTLPIGEAFAGNCPKCQSDKVRKMFTTGGVLGGGRSNDPMPPPSCATGGCGGGMCGIG